MRLTERDFEILREIERFRFCLGRHIKIMANFTGSRACDRRLRELLDVGYIERKKIIYGVPSLYFLTSKGKTLIGKKARSDNIRIDKIAHEITVLDTVCYFIQNLNINLRDITTERQLFSENGFNTRKHYPDLIFKADNITACVEIELSVKDRARFEKNLQENFITYDMQIWVVPKTGYKIRQYLNDCMNSYPNIEILDLEEIKNNE